MAAQRKGSTAGGFITGIIVVIIVGVIVGLVGIYSGVYNVSAIRPDGRLARWFFSRMSDRSVEAHAADVKVPSLDDPAMAVLGAGHYAAMCASCHGAPGVAKTDLAQGLRPRAPNLARSATHMSSAQLFWVTKNGIRMTGMPAWGVTHSDEEIWDIVAFLVKMPKMTPAEYQTLTKEGAAKVKPEK
jgi:mono/diheme cytochrome c family protein